MYDSLENSKNEKTMLTTKKIKKNIELTTLIFEVVLGCLKLTAKTKKLDSKSSIKLVNASNWLFAE